MGGAATCCLPALLIAYHHHRHQLIFSIPCLPLRKAYRKQIFASHPGQPGRGGSPGGFVLNRLEVAPVRSFESDFITVLCQL